ncbi:hypothetical protein L873DRAFT_1787724 [Choiromyces venosus 120613-1]|uniref:Actin cytoskeleton-regulatory complex protein SLA1 n=1 Tax=Choiromyces venosus 120613-1 TaxID=1336337 RepID=A0A3N4JZ62_9PEZI|nr:hypothetical protein L873DRAFT_1787724 [Choiromyces venosus 120613-1]
MTSPFLGVYTAVYAYTPRDDQELTLEEGDLLYILEKSSDDDWWKAKKKSKAEEEEEPIGLVPVTYIEEAKPVSKSKALYSYTRQTDEEVSFAEDATLDVYDDISDPDWALVGYNGEFGFAPTNYIEKIGAGEGNSSASPAAASPPSPVQAPVATSKHVSFSAPPREDTPPPPTPPRPQSQEYSPAQSPAANVAAAMQQRISQHSVSSPRSLSSGMASPTGSTPQSYRDRPQEQSHERSGDRSHDRNHDRDYDREHDREHGRSHERRSKPEKKYVHELSDSEEEDGPRIPFRRPGQPRHGVEGGHSHGRDSPPIPPGFQTYPVQEVDSRKKRAATLGLGPARIILLPDKSSRPKEEWSVENLKGYNVEGKHVFLELEKPSRSLDLHAGSKDTAEQIISALAEIRGAVKAAGISEVFAAASGGGKRSDIGTVLCDFAAQGEDEVSVTTGDEVLILDQSNDEWWLVRRQVNGMEGVVPASFIERGRSKVATPGIMASPSDPKERVKMQEHGGDRRASGIPQRTSSLAGNHSRDNRRRRPGSVVSDQAGSGKQSMPQHNRSRYRVSGPWGAILLTAAITEPDSSQVRQWTDRTGNFKVEAQFIGCKDGKINLHKLNGVKIAVPVSKMSLEDLEYVESRTGISLDEDKPLMGLRNRQIAPPQPQAGISIAPSGGRASSPAARSPQFQAGANPKPADSYDWFDFFLTCGVEVNNCQRYANAFQRDNMDESVLEIITPEVMRTLGLKEGDILRVMKKLDEKFGRAKKNGVRWDDEESSGNQDGSLFSGPGGALKNNTRKGRPPPAIQTPDSVDPKAFEQQNETKSSETPAPASKSSPAAQEDQKAGGFEDSAWDVKPASKPQSPPPQQAPRITSPAASAPTQQKPAVAPPQQPTGALGDLLSLSTPPLQPTIQSPPPPQIPVQSAPLPLAQPPPQQQQAFVPQQTGIGFQNTNIPSPPPMPGQFGMPQPNTMNTFNTMNQPTNQLVQGRQRPLAPAISGATGGNLSIPPPPARPVSAPQNFTTPNTAPNRLTPSFTGTQQPMNYGSAQTQQFPFQSYVGGIPSTLSMRPTGSTFSTMSTGFSVPTMSMNGQPLNSGIQQPMPQHPPVPAFQAPIISQPTGLMMQQYGIPQQQTGFQTSINAQPTGRGFGVNSVLPPPLIPQPTGLQLANTLLPQKTGPPPTVKFGVDAKKLTPQPTGRANLSKASTYLLLSKDFIPLTNAFEPYSSRKSFRVLIFHLD